jgi:hypothetical protein
MSESMIEAIRVHIVGSDAPLAVTSQPEAKPGRRDNLRTFNITTDPVMVLPNAPKRRNAILTVLGTAATDVLFLCGSYADAQDLNGAIARDGQVIPLTGSSEIWCASADTMRLGVFAEYDE